jgi:prepilin-type N-terminal cleavage/methylation domain-containing protein
VIDTVAESRKHHIKSPIAIDGVVSPYSSRAARCSATRAFTLIEMIVVLVLIAIMAALAVPRMSGNEQREFKIAVDQVSDLLTMYAQRQNLGQKMIGIYHDRYRNSLDLVVLDTDGDPANHSASWRPDTYVKPVILPRFMLENDVAISVDGDAVDASEYPITCEIGQERPWLEIAMRGGGERALISLAPYGVAPTLSASFASAGVQRTKYDLDGAGRSREDW